MIPIDNIFSQELERFDKLNNKVCDNNELNSDTIVLKTIDYELLENNDNIFRIKLKDKISLINSKRYIIFLIEFERTHLIAKFNAYANDIFSSEIVTNCHMYFLKSSNNCPMLCLGENDNEITFHKIKIQGNLINDVQDSIILSTKDYKLLKNESNLFEIQIINKLNKIRSSKIPIIVIEFEQNKYIATGKHLESKQYTKGFDFEYLYDDYENLIIFNFDRLSFSKIDFP